MFSGVTHLLLTTITYYLLDKSEEIKWLQCHSSFAHHLPAFRKRPRLYCPSNVPDYNPLIFLVHLYSSLFRNVCQLPKSKEIIGFYLTTTTTPIFAQYIFRTIFSSCLIPECMSAPEIGKRNCVSELQI